MIVLLLGAVGAVVVAVLALWLLWRRLEGVVVDEVRSGLERFAHVQTRHEVVVSQHIEHYDKGVKKLADQQAAHDARLHWVEQWVRHWVQH